MRDLILACVVFGSLPFILKRPFWGILMLAWLGYMNPHRLAWGFMTGFPVVQLVVIVTLVGMLVSKEAKRMVWSREITVLVLFVIWMGVTTAFAMYPSLAQEQYTKIIKIQILTFMTLLMLTSREKVHLFVWVMALSLAFYGVKGGVFTIVNGGSYRVQGPPGTFIGGNNELALALVMTIPLLRYLALQETRKLLRAGLNVAMFLCAIAAIGSQSRGALVALLITGSIFWVKGRHKIATGMFIIVAAVTVVMLMPESWYERMATIRTYQEDGSAMGRINAWWTAFYVAMDRPFGGGFEMFQWQTFKAYAPEPDRVHDAHSIYFEVLGEHGFVGLFFFLTLLGMTWFKCNAIRKRARLDAGNAWAGDLAAMVQVSLVAYLSGGAFLGLAYFDYFYHLVAVVVVTHSLIDAKPVVPAAATTTAPSAGGPPTRRRPEGRVGVGMGASRPLQ